ncbi:hypothetical protein HETIRDRAFT_436258 [Heterobasidion irregulare TC 32-1]|uniref:UPF3 domain-containing protein n=1 Tax=Heterobasidion irregulare (strain TC 32-1) TaxID=747525 RepID=W4JUX5_HETIT|nr:uncharacterized protein HETIRDRAFT_436258 [Heterobasidion irregulare TC 32-1]ETW77358.1 hypothetical protein HETIRDRAFT_436258 [Heterobasidion irregulare TC 32-1]
MESSKSKLKPKEKRQTQSRPSGHERLKSIVRRLPPNLPEDIFWQSVQSWVTDDTVSWKAFYPGKLRKKLNKENVSSRAYIAFKTEDILASFSREYDGHIFRDKTGNEFQAVVEFAPYQKIPLEKKKADSRNGTIEKDEDFISFMQVLEASSAKLIDTEQLLDTLIASTQPVPMPKSTPLLEALKAEKSAQKDKEAILRNHPHYKDAAALSKKEDAKRRGAVPAPAKQSDIPSAGSKKGSKKATSAAQKQTSSSTSQPKNGSSPTTVPMTVSKAPPTGPKSGRSGRPQAQAQDTQPPRSPITPATTVATSVPSASISALPETAPPSTGSGATGRRPRPILGLASRQFEAALSGAGVSKPKRERAAEKDKGKDREKDKDKGVESRDPNEDGAKGKERERRREDRAEGKSTKQAKAEKTPAVPTVPAILHREGASQVTPRILTRPLDVEGNAVVPTPPSGAEGTRGRGFGKSRGRGRGRGKETR